MRRYTSACRIVKCFRERSSDWTASSIIALYDPNTPDQRIRLVVPPATTSGGDTEIAHNGCKQNSSILPFPSRICSVRDRIDLVGCHDPIAFVVPFDLLPTSIAYAHNRMWVVINLCSKSGATIMGHWISRATTCSWESGWHKIRIYDFHFESVTVESECNVLKLNQRF